MPVDASLPTLVSAAGGIMLRIDLLGAFFLALVAAVSLPAAIYGTAYMAEYDGHRSLPVFGLMFNAFLLGMSLVPCAGNIFTFVLAWELMAVASYFLVMTESEHADTRQAGLWYAAMTHLGLVLLLPMFFLLAAGSAGTAFADLRAGATIVTAGTRNVVFLLALAAFGSKAGIVPLHVWLPRAHPAAPSHVSALMSGVMIKLGIYGLVRVMFDFLPGGPAWWGGVVLAVGSLSALLGVLYALVEHDLKRLLAYHSVENIGIILIGLGAGSILHGVGLRALATIGFAGALFHTLNHACFKGLLFLGAGSVVQQTHTRNMEEMGGLIKSMPHTALAFLIGSAAIAALPPLNGFASEWLVFQSLLAGTYISRPEIAVGFPIAVGMLALTSGLAAACFVKAFGISFLAMPRSDHAAQARESHWSMRAMMAVLAGGCVVFGLAAPVIIRGLYSVLDSVPGLSTGVLGPQPSSLWLIVPRPASVSAASFMRIGRTPTDVALLNAAALVEVSDGIFKQVRLALGGVGMEPVRISSVEKQLEGQPVANPGDANNALDTQRIFAAVQANIANFSPPADFRASSGYRRVSGINLAFRVLEEATNISRWRSMVSSEGRR